MKYKQLIFDVDDTLIDFAATEDSSLHALFKSHKLPLSSDLQKQYHTYNQGLWRRLELGEITYDELSEMTFHDFIKENFNLDVDGNECMNEYRSYFKDYFDLIVSSEEAHYSKPNPHAFDYFFSRTEIGPNETLFFGDGLQSDILGAEKYGFDSIWYNHRHRKDTIGLHPLFEVETYPEFVKIMQNDFQKAY